MITLVTGACGFVGCALVEGLVARGDTVVGIDVIDPPTSLLSDLAGAPGSVAFHKADVRDAAALARVFDGAGVDRVIHTATITANQARDAASPDLVASVNIVGMTRIMMACRDAGVSRLVFSSSSAAYGNAVFGDAPLTEDIPGDPRSMYEITKFAAERTALRLGQLYGVDVRIGRLSTVYGPWERGTGVRDTLSPMFQIQACARTGETARLERPGIRDWIHVRDAAGGLIALFDMATDAPAIINVTPGPDACFAVLDWGRRLARRFPGFDCRLAEPGETPNILLHQRQDRAPLDNRLLQRHTRFRPVHDMESGADDYAEWLSNHEDF